MLCSTNPFNKALLEISDLILQYKHCKNCTLPNEGHVTDEQGDVVGKKMAKQL